MRFSRHQYRIMRILNRYVFSQTGHASTCPSGKYRTFSLGTIPRDAGEQAPHWRVGSHVTLIVLMLLR